jgi:hypothetical protein
MGLAIQPEGVGAGSQRSPRDREVGPPETQGHGSEAPMAGSLRCAVLPPGDSPRLRAGGSPEWNPIQLRHAAATRIRKEYGLDTAQAVLGHRTPSMTLVYAEADRSRALRAMEEVG